MRNLYGVFTGLAWAITANKRKALKLAKDNHGTVRSMPYIKGANCWDAPTFKACSDLIADYR